MYYNCLEFQLITVRLTKGYSTTNNCLIPVYDAFTSCVEGRGDIPPPIGGGGKTLGVVRSYLPHG